MKNETTLKLSYSGYTHIFLAKHHASCTLARTHESQHAPACTDSVDYKVLTDTLILSGVRSTPMKNLHFSVCPLVSNNYNFVESSYVEREQLTHNAMR